MWSSWFFDQKLGFMTNSESTMGPLKPTPKPNLRFWDGKFGFGATEEFIWHWPSDFWLAIFQLSNRGQYIREQPMEACSDRSTQWKLEQNFRQTWLALFFSPRSLPASSFNPYSLKIPLLVSADEQGFARIMNPKLTTNETGVNEIRYFLIIRRRRL